MKQRILTQKRYLLPLLGLIVLVLTIILHGIRDQPAYSSAQPGSPVPIVQDEILGARPDWAQITFRTLPAILESGSFQAPAELVQQLGYNPSRIWQAGQTADQYMLLGDFQDTFQLQQFSLESISALAGIDLEALRLSDLGLLNWQNIEDLVQAIPGLADYQVEDVLPIADLVAGAADPQSTIGDIIQDEALASLSLGDLDLEQYGLSSIPGLSDAPVERFSNWQQSAIEQVPGLANVPFASFPNPVVEQGAMVGMVDVVFGAMEGDRTRTISGSYVEGFNVPCTTNCAHLEMGQPESLKGSQWISGKYQQVRGGEGVLSAANGGKEPTGRHPFGRAFKVAMLEPDEASGTAETGLYFRICIRTPAVDLGCTPYFIGPVPWLPVQEEGSAILGQFGEGLAALSSPTAAATALEGGLQPGTSSFTSSAVTEPAQASEITASNFVHPMPGSSIAESFGDRTHPVHGDRRLQSGTQFSTAPEAAVQATAGGQVTYAGSSADGRGNLVVVDHGNGLETRYAQLQNVSVREGDVIAQGQSVGSAGSGKDAVHFEVRQNGQPKDPMSVIGQKPGGIP